MREISSDYIFLGNAGHLRDATITINDKGIIQAVKSGISQNAEYFKGAVCPGFINVHCHLELSFAKGRILEGGGIDTFIHELEKLKRTISTDDKETAIHEVLVEIQQNGTVGVGDIMNTSDSIEAKQNSPIDFYNFVEVYGSQAKDAELVWNRALGLFGKLSGSRNIIPHAPYSLSRTLFQKIRDFQKPDTTLSMHHLESEAEAEYFLEGKGLLADRFRSWGLEMPSNIPTHKRPLESLADFLQTADRLLLIHNTFISSEDLEYSNKRFRNMYYGLCPNANLYIEKELPPIELIKNNGAKICIGTDSLASNHQLSILEELKTLEKETTTSVEDLIQWATYNGALALGMEEERGSIEVGKKPGLVHLQDFDMSLDRPLSKSSSRLITN